MNKSTSLDYNHKLNIRTFLKAAFVAGLMYTTELGLARWINLFHEIFDVYFNTPVFKNIFALFIFFLLLFGCFNVKKNLPFSGKLQTKMSSVVILRGKWTEDQFLSCAYFYRWTYKKQNDYTWGTMQCCRPHHHILTSVSITDMTTAKRMGQETWHVVWSVLFWHL